MPAAWARGVVATVCQLSRIRISGFGTHSVYGKRITGAHILCLCGRFLLSKSQPAKDSGEEVPLLPVVPITCNGAAKDKDA